MPRRTTPRTLHLGGAVRYARTQAGLTQAALAAKLGVTQPTIAEWENGRNDVRLHRLEAIANSTGIPLHELLERVERITP